MSGNWKPISLAPGLYFVPTPLGNARDITLRALDILASADVLAAEDTRSLRRLMEIHGVPLDGRRVLAYHDHNGAAQRPHLLKLLAEEKSVAYASDAGTPLVADPGYALARDAVAEGACLHAVPGPAAAIAALTVAGLPSDRFTFVGFAPNAKGPRRKFLSRLKDDEGTTILYESPKRVAAMLAEAVDVLGADRPCALCRELTKKFEEVRRGTLAEVLATVEETPPKGEIVICIGAGDGSVDPVEVEAALREAMARLKLKDAAKEVAERFGVSKRDLYQLGLTFS